MSCFRHEEVEEVKVDTDRYSCSCCSVWLVHTCGSPLNPTRPANPKGLSPGNSGASTSIDIRVSKSVRFYSLATLASFALQFRSLQFPHWMNRSFQAERCGPAEACSINSVLVKCTSLGFWKKVE